MYRNIGILITALLLLFGSPVLSAETKESEENQQDSSSPNEDQDKLKPIPLPIPMHSGGYASIGAQFSELDDSQKRVSEFGAVRQGTRPTARTGIWGYVNGFAYDISASRGVDPSDQDYRVGMDLRRYWTSEVEFSKLPHRLLTDPLTNLDTAKGGPMVQYTSNDENINYCPAYQDLLWKNRITLPGLSLLSVHFDYRNQMRKGSYQARTMSKCSTCHVESEIREMDREIEEFRTGLELGNSVAGIEYEFLNRDLQEHSGSPFQIYDEVEHPVFQTRVFTNRAQFEESDGPLPFNQIPRFKKNRHLLRGRFDAGEAGQIVGTFLDDRSDNSSVGYGVTSQIASGYYAVKIGDRIRLNAKARNLDMDSDTIFIDVNERVADGGPQAGLTYPESYPDVGELDFLKSSELERDTFDFRADARILLAPRTLLRLGYEFEEVNRPHFDVPETRSNYLRIGLSTRLHDSWRGRVRYVYTKTENPFLHEHAALPPALQPFPSPNNSPFAGTQYFTIYEAREVDLSNFPSDSHELTASTTWSPTERISLSGHLRVKDYSNDELTQLFTWSDSVVAPSLELWVAPTDRFDLLASYTLHHRKTDSLFGIAVYDG